MKPEFTAATPVGPIRFTADPKLDPGELRIAAAEQESALTNRARSFIGPVTVTAESMAEAQRRISALALQPLAPFRLKYQSEDHVEARLGYYMGIGPTIKGTFYVPPATVDPLDVEYDGVKLRVLLNVQRQHDQGGYRPVNQITPAQRAAVSAHWSAQLRARVAASAAADKARATSVVVDLEDW